MTRSAPNVATASRLIEALTVLGVRDIVLAPGSRHTPIVLAAEASRARVHTVLDERSAGFFALGLARVTGRPAVVCCTSGSAGAHLLPAVVEADRSRLPLLVLTADRPPELQHVGAPQTIDQRHLLAGYVRLYADPGAPDAAGGEAWPATLAALAVDAATGDRPGPVHLNVPFRKPLWDGEPTAPSRPPPRILRGPATLADADLDRLAAELGDVERGVIVCGPGDPSVLGAPRIGVDAALRSGVGRLAEALGWPLIAEAVSPVRSLGQGVITTADGLLRSEPFAARMAPDLILRFGQTATSRPVAAWCARHRDASTWLVDATGQVHDPDHVADQVLAADPSRLATALAQRLGGSTKASASWHDAWLAAEVAARRVIDEATAGGHAWGGAVARAVSRALGPGALLHVASSMAIRDLDGFGLAPAHPVVITANRGTNGIDGTISTALGQAAAWRGGPVVALMGDLAFLHDLGALVTACRPSAGPSARVRLVVVDNRGGGIFDHLPIADHPRAFEPHFVTAQGADIGPICRGAGVPCHRLDDPRALETWLADASEAPLAVAHVPIDRADDLRRHHAAWDAIARAIDVPPTRTASSHPPMRSTP